MKSVLRIDMKAYSMLKHRDDYPWQSVYQGFHNMDYEVVARHIDADILVTWLPWANTLHHSAGEFHKSQGKLWLVMENGYLPNIHGEKYYVVGTNGYNGNGLNTGINYHSDRWGSFNLEIKPWRESGEAILVIGQFGHQDTRYSMPQNWPDSVLTRLRKITDRPIIYRPKPTRPRLPSNSYPNVVIDSDVDLIEQFGNVHAIVTWNSPSISSKALLEGVPIFIDAPNCIAKKLSAGDIIDIESPRKLSREQFFYNLAYSQWSKEEIENGMPFKLLQRSLACAS